MNRTLYRPNNTSLSSIGDAMANHFEFLTRAKPASVYKLLQRLPSEDAAIVLTSLPQAFVVQIMAYFPDEKQASLLPAMRAARQLPPERKAETAKMINAIIRPPKTDEQTNPDAAPTAPPAAQPEPLSERTHPIPIVRPPTPPNRGEARSAPPEAKPETPPEPAEEAPAETPPAAPRRAVGMRPGGPGGNPYQTAPAPKTPVFDDTAERDAQPSSLTNLGTKLKDAFMAGLQNFNGSKENSRESGKENAGEKEDAPRGEPARRTSSIPPPRRRREPPGKPVPWVPRAATSSPINGPALPGKPPPVAGDPLESPLAQAGLLDLIGRAQEKFMPKPGGPARKGGQPPRLPNRPAARRPLGGKRPEPREGVALPGEIQVGDTPRVIGPRAPAPPPAREKGARRMDGKAILAAILREAGPEIRHTVQDDDPALFKQLRERMFYFDDLIFTDDNSLARVFTAAPADVAGLALKFAAPALRDRVLRVVSPGRARALLDMPRRAGLDAVESAQEKVLGIALQLQAAGRILIDPRDPDLAGAGM